MNPPLEGDPAFILDEGVGYVRAWAEAQHVVRDLRAVLDKIGRSEAMPYLHADVTEFGSGVVEPGRVTPQTAALLVKALKLLSDQTRHEAA
jgi:hypothetical protein